jgi:hypothetical protein
MAVVNLRLSEDASTDTLNNLLSDVTDLKIYLANSEGTISGLSEPVVFASATYDSVNKLAYLDLDGVVYFTVDPETTIDRLNVIGTKDSATYTLIIDEMVTERYYEDTGIYVVSDIIINLGGQ